MWLLFEVGCGQMLCMWQDKCKWVEFVSTIIINIFIKYQNIWIVISYFGINLFICNPKNQKIKSSEEVSCFVLVVSHACRSCISKKSLRWITKPILKHLFVKEMKYSNTREQYSFTGIKWIEEQNKLRPVFISGPQKRGNFPNHPPHHPHVYGDLCTALY